MKHRKYPHGKDPATEPRDRWIYEQCVAGCDYRAIIEVLARNTCGWRPIASKVGIYCAALRHAERHDLERPKKRACGREPDRP